MRNGEQGACNASLVDARRRAGGLRWSPGAWTDRAVIGPAPATPAATPYLSPIRASFPKVTPDALRPLAGVTLQILTCRGESRPDGMTTQATEADGAYRVTDVCAGVRVRVGR